MKDLSLATNLFYKIFMVTKFICHDSKNESLLLIHFQSNLIHRQVKGQVWMKSRQTLTDQFSASFFVCMQILARKPLTKYICYFSSKKWPLKSLKLNDVTNSLWKQIVFQLQKKYQEVHKSNFTTKDTFI